MGDPVEEINKDISFDGEDQVKIERNSDLYPQDLQTVLASCLKDEIFTDVTLYCRRKSSKENSDERWVGIKANLSVLVAASPYIKRIINNTKLMDYNIIMDGFSYEEVYTLVNYAYTGVVDSSQNEIVNLKYLVETFELGMCTREQNNSVETVGWNLMEIKSDKVPFTSAQRKKTEEKESSSPSSRTCEICGKLFARPALMLNHLRVHTGEKPFTCSVCNRSYREKSHLTRHQRCHTENSRPFQCEICDKSYANAFYLSQHRLTHSGYKRLLCSTCGYQCFQVSDLNKHMRTHTGEKPYVCGFCGKAFSQKVSCIKHQQSVHKAAVDLTEVQQPLSSCTD